MALLDEANLAAEIAKRAKHRLNHVGTKLNEEELRGLEELAAKRKQRPAELIRGLLLREIKQEREGLQPSAELIEITAVRLLLMNLFKAKIVHGELLSEKMWDEYLSEVKKRKRKGAMRVLQELESSEPKS